MAEESTGDFQKALEQDLVTQLRFQRRWRILSMSAYVLTTVGALVCSVGATYFAAAGSVPNVAAILAAITTILVGIEKSLLFREKWKFHLLMFTKLNVRSIISARLFGTGTLGIIERHT